jgi:hypothetical protein
MSFKSAADGIAKKGKTEGKNYGESGPTASIQRNVKGGGGKTNEDMLKMGRGMAKVANQKRSK